MENPSVKGFVEKLNDRLIEGNPMARVDHVKVTVHGDTVDTEIKLVPIGAISSAEAWHKVSKSVELEIMGFAKLFLDDGKKGLVDLKKGRVGGTMEETMERERKSFTRVLKKGEVTFIDPEDVAS
jgi:hypothetical protein